MFCFFFNDTATTEIYTLSLHDALPISSASQHLPSRLTACGRFCAATTRAAKSRSSARKEKSSGGMRARDRKSTRLNSSHLVISYAVFCLKKKNEVATLRYRTSTHVATR